MSSYHTSITLIILTLSLSSCSVIYDYTYHIDNMTDCTISVAVASDEHRHILLIPPQGKMIIFITDHGAEGVGGPFFAPVQQDIHDLEIIKNDTLIYQKDPLYDPNWTYIDGNYTLEISIEDF